MTEMNGQHPAGRHVADTGPTGPEVDSGGPPSNDPDAIQADIERTREQLAATVDQLTAKLDVKSRARAGAADATARAKAQAAAHPAPLAVAGAVALGVVVLLVLRRRGAR